MEKIELKRKRLAGNFRQLLQEELLDRCRANPNYSLRSFARALSIEASALSQIINGKRTLTEKMKLRLGTALGLSVFQLKNIATTAEDQAIRDNLPPYQEMTLDAFAALSDWYHYAILELTYLENFKADAQWISRRLGITKSEANIAVERLFRLGLLKKTSENQWLDTSENGRLTHLNSSMTSDAAKKYQIQLLELSQKAIQEVAFEKRNHTSAAFCFDPEDLANAVQRISEFRRRFAQEFQPKAKGKGKEVYQIQISFFPLTKNTHNKEII